MLKVFFSQRYGMTAKRHRSVRISILAGVMPFMPFMPSVPFYPEAAEAQQSIPTPQSVIGFPVGADSMLADWTQIGGYLSQLADASPHIRLDTIGQSTLGRPLLLVTMTAPRHQARLDAIKDAQRRLADPRMLSSQEEESLVRETPVVVFINNNIHSTEIASSQFSMELAYRLATEEQYRALLENVIVLMTPSANPDGLDTVVAWYREHKGSRYEAGPLPWLYHPYVGHDNNRDWFMLTQVESQAIARVLYHEWFPEVVWDVHHMSSRGARLFVPPFDNPVNPNLDPMLVAATNLVGSAMAAAVYDAGKIGIEHQRSFDLWWHGGFRTAPARHNMIGILSETASARLASPIHQNAGDLQQQEQGVNLPARWQGGWWRLRDIVDYELLAADGLLHLVASQRETFVRRFVTMGRRAIAAGEAGRPFAFVIPPPPQQRDPASAVLLANTLIRGGAEVRRASDEFRADDRTYPEGTLVVPMAQPFRAHAKDLLEVQDYPDRRLYPGGPPDRPYDVAGWTLPLQMRVQVDQVDEPFDYAGELLAQVVVTPGAVQGSGTQRLLSNRTNMESRTIAEALRLGARLWVVRNPVSHRGRTVPAGAVVLEDRANPDRLDSLVRDHVQRFGFDAWAAEGLQPDGAVLNHLPRIGLYKPWTASMDEGWTRWVLEQHGIPYQTITDSVVRAGDLESSIDVLILPDMSGRSIVSGYSPTSVPPQFSGGIGTEGTEHVAQFVRGGGGLVTLDASSSFAISSLNLPVRNGLASTSGSSEGSIFYAPGSIFGVALDLGSPLTSGMDDSVHVYFANSMAFEAAAPARVLGSYMSQPLRSGYVVGQEKLVGRAALVDVPAGRGRVIMFGFRSQHRGQTHGTFKLLFNAVLLGALR